MFARFPHMIPNRRVGDQGAPSNVAEWPVCLNGGFQTEVHSLYHNAPQSLQTRSTALPYIKGVAVVYGKQCPQCFHCSPEWISLDCHLQKGHGWSQDNLEAFNSSSVNLIPLQTLGLLRGGTFFPVSVPIEDLDGVIVKDIAQMDDGQHSPNEEDAECMPNEIKIWTEARSLRSQPGMTSQLR